MIKQATPLQHLHNDESSCTRIAIYVACLSIWEFTKQNSQENNKENNFPDHHQFARHPIVVPHLKLLNLRSGLSSSARF